MEIHSIEAFYLQTDSATAFATLHRPTVDAPSGVGVLMCPSFGWKQLCIYRNQWFWANQLAAAGHTVLRFDLPGNGDSAGNPSDEQLLPRWLEIAAAGAAHLRTASGCSRVAALGIGFGGQLAWAAAASGAAIDDFMLWAVPIEGRRVIRELRAGVALDLDPEVDQLAAERFEASLEPGCDPLLGGFLDESGQIVSGELIDAFDRIDLTKLTLDEPRSIQAADRHALIFVRQHSSADQQLAELARGAGVDVSIAAGDEYSGMIRYVQRSQKPLLAIAESKRWLAELDRARPSALYPDSVGYRVTSTMTLGGPGAAIRERPITLEVGSDSLRGILTEPLDAPRVENLCAVWVSGSADRRIGPNRMWVESARRWASHGVCSVRIDMVGVADSDGDESRWDNVPFHHEIGRIHELRDVLDAVQETGLANRFILTGFCSGASKSVRLANIDPRVVGVFTIGLPFFKPRTWTSYVRDWWVVDWQPKPATAHYRVVIMRALQGTLRGVRDVQHGLLRRLPRRFDPDKQKLVELSARGTETLFLIAPKSHQLADLLADRRPDRVIAMPHSRTLALPSNDVRFRPLPAQYLINTELDVSLERLLTRLQASATNGRGAARREAGAAVAVS